MVKINWKTDNAKRTLYFRDLELNQSFRNASGRGQGAVYIKVADGSDQYMYEIATGQLWNPTTSPVELSDVEINISSTKPMLYV